MIYSCKTFLEFVTMMHFQLRCIKILRWLHLSPY